VIYGVRLRSEFGYRYVGLTTAYVLEFVEGLEELGQAEVDWIELLREDGHLLLNLSQGGLGPMGIEWTAEMREAARIRSTGRKGVSRFAEDNPYHGRNHDPEQRARWSKSRKGKNSGPENPNYGRLGEDHPIFGHVMSEQARQQLAEKPKGPCQSELRAAGERGDAREDVGSA
jgi:hypothetical protein